MLYFFILGTKKNANALRIWHRALAVLRNIRIEIKGRGYVTSAYDSTYFAICAAMSLNCCSVSLTRSLRKLRVFSSLRGTR